MEQWGQWAVSMNKWLFLLKDNVKWSIKCDDDEVLFRLIKIQHRGTFIEMTVGLPMSTEKKKKKRS